MKTIVYVRPFEGLNHKSKGKKTKNKKHLLKQTYQDVKAGSFEQSDLVRNGQASETRHLLGKLDHLDDALGGQLAELVPQAKIQLDPVV